MGSGLQGAIKIVTDGWDDVLHDPIIFVSRNGNLHFYIAYVIHMAKITTADHTVTIDISNI